MDEVVDIVTTDFDVITDRWVGTIGSLPKYFGSAQIPFFKSQITELLRCILDLLESRGPSRLVKFTERIVKPPYNGLLTLTTVHETFLLGEDAILSVVREKMRDQDRLFEYSRRIDGCFHEIIYEYANAYQAYQSEVGARRRKVIERQRETLLRFTSALGSANAYDEALRAAAAIVREESKANAVEFFAFDQNTQQLVFRFAVPESVPTAGGDFLSALARQFGGESSARRSYAVMQEVFGHRRLILMLPVSAGDSLIGLLLLAYPSVPLRESSVVDLQEESMNILLAMVDQLGYGLKRFLLEEEVTSKAHYISILTENSADAIVGLDVGGMIVSWNKGAALLFGMQHNEVTGQPFSVLMPMEKKLIGDDEVILKRIRDEGVVKNYELDCETKSGQRIIVSLTGTVLQDEQGTFIGTALIMRDVTQIKQYELELRQTEKLSFIGQISTGIAHEIGTPLNIILGNAEYLMMDMKSGERDYDELKMIIGETNRIAKLIQQLLDFARPKRLRAKPVLLNSEVESVLRLMKNQLDKSSISLSLELEKDLPYVFGDAAQLQEVFVNLIVNAIHSMEKGGKLTISTASKGGPDEGAVEVTISDTGCGIPDDNLEKIFNPFFTTKEVGKGTGLGLAITQRIVQDHKGTISVDSSVGNGTVFKLSF
ncbi:MAG TPA: ATP-binding protein, partial [Candidatus Kryptobacter bacterium]|nr:ATP-binding protein [Candidatus Kryptobacter bacterium]